MAYASPVNAYMHANETKSHTEQILLLYAFAISYMQRAKDAAEQGDHDTRYSLIEKTMSIMRGLRACLNFNTNEQVALALNNYYDALDTMLASIQLQDNKAEICEQVITNLRLVKEAWEKINVVATGSNNSPPPEEESYEPRDVKV